MKKIIVAFLAVFSLSTSFSQSFQGLSYSQYDALASFAANPANLVGSKLKWQVNIIGFDVNAQNDYLFLKGKLIGMASNFDQDVNVGENLNGKPKDLSFGLDTRLPSFSFKIKEKNAIALTMKVRGVLSGNDIDEKFATSLYNEQIDLLSWENFIQDGKTSMGFTSWGEIGIGYARQILDLDKHQLDAGINVKLITNGIVGKLDFQDIEFNLSADSIINVKNSQFNFLGSNELDAFISGEDDETEDFKFAIKSVGFDVGASYAFKLSGKDDYLFKAGVSVNDIGKLKYVASKFSRSFVGNNTDIPGQLILDGSGDYKNFDSIMDILGTRTTPTGEFKVALPTTLNVFLDVRAVKGLYVTVGGQINLLSQKKDNPSSNLPTLLTITPRYENKIFGAFLPMSYNKYGGFNFGAGFRIGQFSIGSNNFLSSLIKKNFSGVNIYTSIGFGKAKKKGKTSEVVQEEEKESTR